MGLVLENANTLARGHFNPHIITPEWLHDHKVWQDDAFEINFGALSRGITFHAKDLEWQVDFDHLIVTSASHDCGSLVAEVIELLPHTPVRAIGNNFNYSCSAADWANRPVPMLGRLGPNEFSEVGDCDQVRWVGVFSKDRVRIEITVTIGQAAVAVIINHHRATHNSEAALDASRKFNHDRDVSEKLIETILGRGAI